MRADFERDLIRERTGARRAAARQRGVHFGRPRKLNPDQLQVASQLLSEGKAVREIARAFNVHETTIYRLDRCFVALVSGNPFITTVIEMAAPGSLEDEGSRMRF